VELLGAWIPPDSVVEKVALKHVRFRGHDLKAALKTRLRVVFFEKDEEKPMHRRLINPLPKHFQLRPKSSNGQLVLSRKNFSIGLLLDCRFGQGGVNG
jgi:hypothetical protein